MTNSSEKQTIQIARSLISCSLEYLPMVSGRAPSYLVPLRCALLINYYSLIVWAFFWIVFQIGALISFVLLGIASFKVRTLSGPFASFGPLLIVACFSLEL
jgi:hypothetical protein